MGHSAAGSGARAVPDMFHWEAFVRRMAQHYRGRINHWIIWNEPDVWDQDHPGSTWAGSEEDYYRLLKTTYLNQGCGPRRPSR
jgi:beta-glucosidase/6-phospho-beta-glucosidase/beta-galactosidase